MQNLIQRRFRDATSHRSYVQHYCTHFHQAKIKSSRTDRGQTLKSAEAEEDKILTSSE